MRNLNNEVVALPNQLVLLLLSRGGGNADENNKKITEIII